MSHGVTLPRFLSLRLSVRDMERLARLQERFEALGVSRHALARAALRSGLDALETSSIVALPSSHEEEN